MKKIIMKLINKNRIILILSFLILFNACSREEVNMSNYIIKSNNGEIEVEEYVNKENKLEINYIYSFEEYNNKVKITYNQLFEIKSIIINDRFKVNLTKKYVDIKHYKKKDFLKTKLLINKSYYNIFFWDIKREGKRNARIEYKSKYKITEVNNDGIIVNLKDYVKIVYEKVKISDNKYFMKIKKNKFSGYSKYEKNFGLKYIEMRNSKNKLMQRDIYKDRSFISIKEFEKISKIKIHNLSDLYKLLKTRNIDLKRYLNGLEDY